MHQQHRGALSVIAELLLQGGGQATGIG